MFTMDFLTLRQVIQQLLYTGVFRAYLKATRKFTDEGYVEIEVKEGVILGCYFVDEQGKTFKWESGDKRLTQAGRLNWKLTQTKNIASQVQSFLSEMMSEQNSCLPKIPYQVVILPFMQLQQWPVVYRQVYSLIDGKRYCANIAQILHKSQQEVEYIVNELHQRGLIQVH